MQGQNANPAQTQQQPQSGNSGRNIGSHIGKPEQGQSGGAPSTQPQGPKASQPQLPGVVQSAASEHQIQLPGDDKNKQGQQQGKEGQQQNAKQAQALQNAFSSTTIHMMSLEEVAAKLQTNLETGLTSNVVKERQEKDGPNVLTPPKQPPWIIRQSKHFIGGFQVLMIAGGILCCVVYGIDQTQSQTLWIGIALFVVVIVTGIFESYQEGRASSLMAGFKNLTESTASVIRDGHRITIPSSELVLGDVCMLEGGQKVTADLRILESRGLKVDNSTLTGEPEPLRRVPECTNNSPAETRNLAFSGTYFTEGSGKGVVFGIGDKTVLGSISSSANQAKRPESTLRKEVRHFVSRMAIIAFLIAIIFVVIGVVKEHITWQTAIVFFIAGVVANIPEGLLPQMTAQLTLVARRMLHRHVLVKNLEIIETLGCTTCVASDKTGTLTQNRMTVAHMWYDLQFYGTLPHDRDAPEPDVTAPTFQQLHRVATLCNRAVFVPKPGEALDVATTAVKGDASETALLRFVQPLRDAIEYRTANPVVGDIPFNSTNKWALTAHKLEDGSYALMMKGAPERILSRCTTIAINGEQMPMEQHANQVVEANRALGRRGERVLAFACLALPSSVSEDVLQNLGEGDPPPEVPLDQMCFVGLMSLLDPPRPGVSGAIAECHRASIRVIMVTGDHPETARSIAKSIGIMPGRTAEEQADFEGVPIEQVDKNQVEAVVIHTADQLPGFTEDDWNYTLSRKQVVFARSLPAQKQKIVQELQARGHIVAVTGDGTNDCPALRQAACGVAMGISGSDIAKNAAQVVLLDDNFCSLVAGIQEGRLIFHNMKKCILYTICHLMPELFPFLMLITARLPLAIETVMLLVIDCGTELVPSVALAWETGEANFMEQPPRNVKTARLASPQLLFMAYIVTGLWEVVVCFWGFFWAMAYYGFNFVDLFGTGRDWQTPTYQLSPESVQMYKELEAKNEVWQRGGGSAHGYTDFFEYRQHALDVAQSAYLYGIVLCQIANIMCCRSRYESLFKRPANKWIFFGIFVALVVINIVVYVPTLNSAFGAATLPAQWIFISAPAIPIMIFFEELRKFCIRRWPRGCVARFTDY